LIKDGHLIARKCGRSTIILAPDLEAFLAGLPCVAPSAPANKAIEVTPIGPKKTQPTEI
jgi:hypothetical protein